MVSYPSTVITNSTVIATDEAKFVLFEYPDPLEIDWIPNWDIFWIPNWDISVESIFGCTKTLRNVVLTDLLDPIWISFQFHPLLLLGEFSDAARSTRVT